MRDSVILSDRGSEQDVSGGEPKTHKEEGQDERTSGKRSSGGGGGVGRETSQRVKAFATKADTMGSVPGPTLWKRADYKTSSSDLQERTHAGTQARTCTKGGRGIGRQTTRTS